MSIYNVALISHFGHGKTSLFDNLLAKRGTVSFKNVSEAKYADSRDDEVEKGSSIKANSAIFEDENGNELNIFDTPGHGDFNAEVVATLSVVDGVLLIVDAIEGPSVHTDTFLRQAIMNHLKPILVLNKLDKAMCELQLSSEECYEHLQNTLDQCNQLISVYLSKHSKEKKEEEEEGYFSPVKNNVIFASSLYGFGFTLEDFAETYHTKFGVDKEKMIHRLWGDHYFNSSKKTWVTRPHSSSDASTVLSVNNTDSTTTTTTSSNKRAFCQFILDPISQIISESLHSDNKDKLDKMLSSLKIASFITGEDKKSIPKHLLRKICFHWLNLTDVVFKTIVSLLPKAVDCLKKKALVSVLSSDKSSDNWLIEQLKSANKDGPLVMYIPRLIPLTNEKGRFIALAKILSGTLHTSSSKFCVLENVSDSQVTHLSNDSIKNSTKIVQIQPRSQHTIDTATVGQIVGLFGLDQSVLKSAICIDANFANHKVNSIGKDRLVPLKFLMDPILKTAVTPKDGKELPKLVEGLKRLNKSDPIVKCFMEETGEHIIAATGEQHMDFLLRELKTLTNNLEFEHKNPIISFVETVSATSSVTCLSKSPNKHNRLYMRASYFEDGLCEAIENKVVDPEDSSQDGKARARVLIDRFGWDANEARKIWCFGPENVGPNIVCDVTQGIQYLNEIKEHVNSGFQWASKEGPLCEEPMRGIKFCISDVTLHADSIHRGAGQLMPTTRRVLYASELTASPRLMEPLYYVEIDCPNEQSSHLYSLMSNKRGSVIDETNHPCVANRTIVKCQLPIMSSFDFGPALRQATGGTAFPTFKFDSWRVLNGDPLQPGTTEYDIIMDIRGRKGLKVELPVLSDFLDKL